MNQTEFWELIGHIDIAKLEKHSADETVVAPLVEKLARLNKEEIESLSAVSRLMDTTMKR